MASSLFGNTPNQQTINNPMQMLQKFNEFKKQFAGQNPEAIVKGMIASGQMTQEQFNNLAQTANSLQQFLK